MPVSGLDCIFFVDQPPILELRDGLVHIRYQIGRDAVLEVVMSRHNYLKARAAGQHILTALSGSAEVIPVAFDSKFERVYDADKEVG